MKNKVLAILAVGLLAGPAAAYATPVTWGMGGLIEDTTQSGVTVGDAFKLLVSFDTSAVLVTTQSGGVFSPGARYEYDPSSLSITMSIGALPDRTFTYSGSSGDLLWLRDNSGDRSCCEAPAVDGLTFQLTDDVTTYVIQAVFRGSILDIFNGPGLPSNPDPRLTDLEISAFGFSDVGGSSTGAITSIYRVPEPSILLQQLLDDVSGVGPGTSLSDKISLAQVYYAASDIQATCAVLTDFLRQVQAQREKKLTFASADQLTADAYAIMDAIGCD